MTEMKPIKRGENGFPYCTSCYILRVQPALAKPTVSETKEMLQTSVGIENAPESSVSRIKQGFERKGTTESKITPSALKSELLKNTIETAAGVSYSVDNEAVAFGSARRPPSFTEHGVPDVTAQVNRALSIPTSNTSETENATSEMSYSTSGYSRAVQPPDSPRDEDSDSSGAVAVIVNEEEKGPRHCVQCGAVDLEMFFVLPDTGDSICESCFICAECRKPLGDDGFVREAKGLLHADCVHFDKCARCNEPIRGRYVVRDKTKIHTSCFVCSLCKKELSGSPFFVKGAKELCSNCHKK